MNEEARMAQKCSRSDAAEKNMKRNERNRAVFGVRAECILNDIQIVTEATVARRRRHRHRCQWCS